MLWTTLAWAGTVFINDVPVEPSDLAGMTLESVSVQMEANGDLRILAPQYTVRPASGVSARSPAPAAPAMPAPTAPTPGRPVASGPVPGPVAVPSSTPVARPLPTSTEPVTAGAWWLYIHDKESQGHEVRVVINDTIVKNARSGEVAILDVGRWLVWGPNAIRIEAVSTQPTGGPLYVYLGRGSDRNGTVDLGTPDIQFTLGRSKQGATLQEFTLQVTP